MNDWIKLMAQRQPRKEDVIRSLLMSMKQAVEKTDSNGTNWTKESRDLLLLELAIPEAGKMLTLDIRGNCKTIADWVNGHAKSKTREKVSVFWDGSCDNGKCGVRILILDCSEESTRLDPLSTRNAGWCWVRIPWMLSWVAVACYKCVR